MSKQATDMTTQTWQWCMSKAVTVTLMTLVTGPLGGSGLGPVAMALPEPPPFGRPTGRIDGGGARFNDTSPLLVMGPTQIRPRFAADGAFVPVPPASTAVGIAPRGSGSR